MGKGVRKTIVLDPVDLYSAYCVLDHVAGEYSESMLTNVRLHREIMHYGVPVRSQDKNRTFRWVCEGRHFSRISLAELCPLLGVMRVVGNPSRPCSGHEIARCPRPGDSDDVL